MRVWFRRSGHADGLWWSLECEGVELSASAVVGSCQFTTEATPGPTTKTPLSERRHVLSFDCERVEWLGSVVRLHSS